GLYPLDLAQYRLVDDRTHCSPLRIGYRAPTGRRCLVFWTVALIPDRSFGADEEPRPGRLHDRDLQLHHLLPTTAAPGAQPTSIQHPLALDDEDRVRPGL